MSLKDVIASDIDNVFFETKEFAENVIIDGKSVPIITDNDALQGLSDLYAMGLAEGEQFIFIKEKDMKRLPLPGHKLLKDGEQWYVRHAIRNEGVYALRIGLTQEGA